MSDILRKIEAYKRDEIAAAKLSAPLAEVKAKAKDAEPPRSFLAALEAKRKAGGSKSARIKPLEGLAF
ncbi:MAG: indole-3-glycerol-phosphate synthase TrpC, partial [Mesorhizobium sp.]